jgi:hypothetical protein
MSVKSETQKILENLVNNLKKEIEENPIERIKESTVCDITFKINSNAELNGFEILLAFGNPNIYIEDDKIAGYWGNNKYSVYYSKKSYDKIWDYVEELNPCNN